MLRNEPTRALVSPLPIWTEQLEPGGVSWTTRKSVTNTGPARPTDRDVARLGELQNALVIGSAPVCSDTAARERDQGAGIGVVFGRMGSSFCRAGHTRGHRFAPVENLNVNSPRFHAHVR